MIEDRRVECHPLALHRYRAEFYFSERLSDELLLCRDYRGGKARSHVFKIDKTVVLDCKKGEKNRQKDDFSEKPDTKTQDSTSSKPKIIRNFQRKSNLVKTAVFV
jgi:hypothetical protein